MTSQSAKTTPTRFPGDLGCGDRDPAHALNLNMEINLNRRTKNVKRPALSRKGCDELIEELTSVAWSDVVSLRLSLDLRLHQALDTVVRPTTMTEAEFAATIASLKIAEAEFLACMKALAFSTPVAPMTSTRETRKVRKDIGDVDEGQTSSEKLEWFADGNFRHIENLREQIGLRQFQPVHEVVCAEQMSPETFEFQKSMLAAHRQIYTVRFDDLATHNDRWRAQRDAPRMKRRAKL